MPSYATAVVRGCGTRTKGGVYAETAHAPNGQPVENFVSDPVVPLPPDYKVVARGVSLIQQVKTGVNHVVDWVGAQDYPNVADFLEEVRRFGMSRKIPRTFPFEQLSPESRYIIVHGRAHVANWRQYSSDGTGDRVCPKQLLTPPRPPETHEFKAHEDRRPMCAGLWWDDVTGGEDESEDVHRLVLRRMPSFTYHARRRPDGVFPDYAPAIVARFPIGRLVVVNDPEGGTHEAALKNASKAAMWLPVHVEEE